MTDCWKPSSGCSRSRHLSWWPLNQASDLVAQTLGAEKVDVLLYEAAKDSLVAMGTSDTPMGRRQHELGLDRVPIANGGAQVRVFQTGEPYLTGHADQDPEQPRGIVEGLGVRSQLDVPLDVGGARRGILSAMSAIPTASASAISASWPRSPLGSAC